MVAGLAVVTRSGWST